MYNFISEWQEKLGVKIVCSQVGGGQVCMLATLAYVRTVNRTQRLATLEPLQQYERDAHTKHAHAPPCTHMCVPCVPGSARLHALKDAAQPRATTHGCMDTCRKKSQWGRQGP